MRLALRRAALDVLREPVVELVVRVEEGRHDKVQQRPQLGHGVLYGRAAEEEAVPAAELKQHLPPLRGRGLDGLGLVQHQVLPPDAVEVLEVRDHQL